MTFKYAIQAILINFPIATFAAGWAETATHNKYVGWACSTGQESPVGIHIWRDDGIYLGGGSASIHREKEVAIACNTASSNHGFDITLDIPKHLLDNKRHRVNIYIISKNGPELIENSPNNVEFGKYDPNLEEPTSIGTVVARSLNARHLESVGHLGLWDGERVIEALNEGGTNKIKRNTWDDFKSRANVWPKVNPKIPTGGSFLKAGQYEVYGCFNYKCLSPTSEPPNELIPDPPYGALEPRLAIARRAYQIYLIGGEYTLSAFPTQSRPGNVTWTSVYCNPFGRGVNCPSKRVINPLPGVYRCDTLILDAYASSALPNWGSSIGANYHVNDLDAYDLWKSRMNSLTTYTTRSPFHIIEKLRTYQW